MARGKKGALEQIATAVDIVAIEGPGEGLHAELDPESALMVGRGLRGLEVPDPHVSLQHAVIEWDGQRYTITDLDSATGTELEGEKLVPNKPSPMAIGQRFKVGGTLFELVERHARWRRMAEMGLLAAMALVLLGGVIWVLAPHREAEITLLWAEPIHQGPRSDPQLALDGDYLRTRGIDPYQITLRRVTDYDHDGVDEVWLIAGERQYAVSFDSDGRWVHLGELPLRCTDVRNSAVGGLPQLDCGRVTMASLDGEPYAAIDQKGVVVWGLKADAWDKPGPPPPELAVPQWATLRRETALAGFLAANAIGEPIHYLVCDQVFPGVPGLVRTARGEIHTLNLGCRDRVDASGGELTRVMALAFTAAGHRALLDDLEVHLSGSTDGLFRSAAQDALSQAWRTPPTDAGGQIVAFESADHFFEPIPPEAPVGAGPRWPSENPDVPLAQTATMVGVGTVSIDPPGCAQLEVTTAPWRCQMAQGCMSSSTFVSVRDVGCTEGSPVLDAPYSGGRVSGAVGDLEVQVRVEVAEGADRLDVLRTRIGWRTATGG